MTTSKFDSVIVNRVLTHDRIQVWILSWSTGCRLNDVKFGFCHGQQGVDSMTSSLDSVIESTGCRLNDRIQVWILSWSTGCRLNDIKFGLIVNTLV